MRVVQKKPEGYDAILVLLWYNKEGLPKPTKISKEVPMDKNSLAHTKWNCKYHIVFTPKYRRQAIYGKIKKRYRSNIKKTLWI